MTCDVCGAGVSHTVTLCQSCVAHIVEALDGIADLWAQLDVVRCRQTTYTTGRIGGRSSHTPLPWVDVTEPEQIIADTLAAWVAEAERDTRSTCRPTTHPTQVTQALWLASKVNWITHLDDGFMLHEEAIHISRLLTGVVDRPAEAQYVGPCSTTTDGCTAELYARPGRDTVQCPTCDTVHVIADRHRELLDAAQDRLETAAVCARAVTVWGEPVRADRIRKWKQRGRITVRGHDTSGAPLYRLGDVIDLAREDVINTAHKRTG